MYYSSIQKSFFSNTVCVFYLEVKEKIISPVSVGKERGVNPLGNLLLPRFVKFINLSAGDSAIYNASFFLHILTSSSLSVTAFHFINIFIFTKRIE